MPITVLQVYTIQAPSPPHKHEWFVVVVSRDSAGEVIHNAIAICPTKSAAQTVVEGLSALHGL